MIAGYRPARAAPSVLVLAPELEQVFVFRYAPSAISGCSRPRFVRSTPLTPTVHAAYSCSEHVQMPTGKVTAKAEETGQRILDAALDLFRNEGFDGATMRAIAAKAGVALGAAYYYYPSKEAIVLAFYERSTTELLPAIQAALKSRGLEARLRGVISAKLDYFTPNRAVLRALLRNGADPSHPLSPFGSNTKEMRDADIESFRCLLDDCGIKIPTDLEPRLPGVLWFLQMGVIFFWVIDGSPNQAKTRQLLGLVSKAITTLIRTSTLPLMRPIRKIALEIIAVVDSD